MRKMLMPNVQLIMHMDDGSEVDVSQQLIDKMAEAAKSKGNRAERRAAFAIARAYKEKS